MRSIFREIYEKEGGVLDITRDSQLSGRGLGAREDQEQYHVTFKYKGTAVTIKCGLGLQSVARITCVLSKNNERNNFVIKTRSHFLLLFSLNKNRLKIETENHNLRKLIEQDSSFKELNSISKRTKFQPVIKGVNKKDSYTLTTEYHLIFDERTETFIPLIQFYKNLIDYLVAP